MRFLYADTKDYVDFDFDFDRERAPTREWNRRGQYAHEVMRQMPYDGLLLSMSAIRRARGIAQDKCRYTLTEQMALLRVGVRQFLRLSDARFDDMMLMGDCGAFAYARQPAPAYSPAEVVEFYADAGFTHGVAPDHIIFACDQTNPPRSTQSADTAQRYDITLANAEQFIRLAYDEGLPFEPMGPVQGWSPASMAAAAADLEAMGYRYLAVGGLVGMNAQAIKPVLAAIRDRLRPETRLHLLGFAKADHIEDVARFGVASMDSTAPLLRAFKDDEANYWLPAAGGGLDHYTAIRVPQAILNARLVRGTKEGRLHPETMQAQEAKALGLLRAFDRGEAALRPTLDAVMDYHRTLLGRQPSSIKATQTLTKVRQQVERTLTERPWKQCSCDICSSLGIEVMIYRGANRNKRRGFHNMAVFRQHVADVTAPAAAPPGDGEEAEADADEAAPVCPPMAA